MACVIRLNHADRALFFDDDEADYATTVQDGFFSAYLGSNESNGYAFAKQVITEYLATGDTRAWRDAYLSQDAAALRHLHPPVGLYPASLLASFGIAREEILRLVPLFFSVLGCAVAGFLAWCLCPAASFGKVNAALWATAIAAASPYAIVISSNFSFHAAYLVSAAATLAFLTLAAKWRSLTHFYIACALLAPCILTIEYWVLLGPAFVYVLIRAADMQSRGIVACIRPAGVGLLILGLALTLLWPPFLWHLGFLKPMIVYAGLLIRPLESSGFHRPWWLEMASTHWLLAGLSVLALIGMRKFLSKDERAGLWPSLLYAFFFVLANLRVAHMKPLYAGQIVPAMAAIAALPIAFFSSRLPRGIRLAFAAIGLAALAWNLHPLLNKESVEWRKGMDVFAEATQGKQVLALDHSPVFKYYLSKAEVIPTPSDSSELHRALESIRSGKMKWVVTKRTSESRWLETFDLPAQGWVRDSVNLGVGWFITWNSPGQE